MPPRSGQPRHRTCHQRLTGRTISAVPASGDRRSVIALDSGAALTARTTIPAGYAPFGVQNLNGTIYVTYALQDPDMHDDVPGEGHGFVNAFDTAGNLLRRVASKGQLNSPWGLALAPADFGNGRIHAFDPGRRTGDQRDEFQTRGPLHSADGAPIQIDGLWGLAFGRGSANLGPTNTLFFTAGPLGEAHGLFGKLDVAPHPD